MFLKSTPVEEIHHVYKDYIKIPEVAEEQEKLLVELMYDPTSCIRTGSCCSFEGKRYEHCGPLIDRSYRTHDTEIKGEKATARCTPHRNLLNWISGLKEPGDTTIRNGIRLDMVKSFCILA
ncbi:hypothetical protein [Oceanobacillus picturae]|uniref:hypothetical protein n=1 Tax=Oceanobacillus picturae TaxID=171693 RepID=UPI003643C62E